MENKDIESILGYEETKLFQALSYCSDKTYIFVCDVQSKKVLWSQSTVEYFGLSAQVLSCDYALQEWRDLVHSGDLQIFNSDLDYVLEKNHSQYSSEYRVKNAAGKYTWVTCKGKMLQSNGERVVFAGFITNMGIVAKIDKTTNLRTVLVMRDDIDNMISNKQHGAAMLISLIGFKAINDRYGYDFGDTVLGTVAKNIESLLHDDDRLYRMNGADFAILSPNATKENITLLKAGIDSVTETMEIEGKTIHIDLYTAVTSFPEDGNNSDIVQSNLFYTLEQAKKHRNFSIEYFDNRTYFERAHAQDIKDAIRSSVKHGCKGFRIVLQPIIDVKTGKCVSAEALMRFTSDGLGVLSPGEFIPVLEDSGFIIDVGKWLIDECMKLIRCWLDSEVRNMLNTLNINISYIQFKDPTLIDYVLSELNKYDIGHERVTLELTESCRVESSMELAKVMQVFKENDIKLALDDFGTGYASLIVLRDVPTDIVKLDHTLIKTISDNVKDKSLIESIITFCKKADIKVVAEGVENTTILNIVESAGADYVQGYFYDKPLECDDFYTKYIK